MSKFRLTIDMANAAFDGDQAGEVARILRELAVKIASEGLGLHDLRDVNGNRVGMAGSVATDDSHGSK